MNELQRESHNAPWGRDEEVGELQAKLARSEARVRELEAALARSEGSVVVSQQELDEVAYVAAHDLKAPLRGIANLSTWVEDDLGDRMTAESRSHMKLLRGRVQRLEGLIDGILSYARAIRARTPPTRVDVDLLVKDTVALLAPSGSASLILGPLPVLVTERAALGQVFLHLLGNALKHGGDGSHAVHVSAVEHEAAWEFVVHDDGPGVPAAFRERIWGMFQTLEPRDKVEATGIGLAIVRKIVEARGGRAWLDDAPTGATFRFTWKKSREGSLP